MYLYYDSNYTLKEIINDKAIIADSVNANKIYVMFETDQLESGYDLSYIRYRSGGNNYSMFYTEDLVTDPFADTPDDNCYVPFNKNRDLKFFKYGKSYRFRVFNIPTEILTNTSVSATVWYVLDTDQDTQIVNGEIVNGDDDQTLSMEMFAFAVNPSANKVSIDTVISLAQWSQLVILISKIAGFDPTQIESAIETLQSYFTNGSANNALQFGDHNPNYYATHDEVEIMQSEIDALQRFEIIISNSAATTPNVTTSAATQGKLYFVPLTGEDPSDNYAEYITALHSGVYNWELLGTTSGVNLTGVSKMATFTNVMPIWSSDTTYIDYPYKGVASIQGVTASMFADVVFSVEQATSGDYAPICETGDGTITVYSKVNTAILIPLVKVEWTL